MGCILLCKQMVVCGEDGERGNRRGGPGAAEWYACLLLEGLYMLAAMSPTCKQRLAPPHPLGTSADMC
jgi:hypothetical protein